MSGPTVSTITIDSAPREPEKLANIGRFQLRRLAETLGLLVDENKKNAFMSSTPTEMSQVVSMALKNRDGGAPALPTHTNGSNGHALAQEPVREPATTVQESEPVREPTTPRTRSKSAEKAAMAPASDETTTQLKALTAELSTISASLVALVKGLDQGALIQKVDGIRSVVEGIYDQNKVLCAIVLTLAEQHLNASRGEILQQVAQEVPFVMKDIAFAAQQVEQAEAAKKK